MDLLIAGLERSGFKQGDFLKPDNFDVSAITTVHSPDYIDFLQTAWERWKAAGYAGDVFPMSYPFNPRRKTPPVDIDGAAGFYCSSSDTVVTETLSLIHI